MLVSIPNKTEKLGEYLSLITLYTYIFSGTYNKPPEEIEPIVAAVELIKRGHPVVLHLAARNVNKKSVAKILEYIRQVGIRNLLVVRGGKRNYILAFHLTVKTCK